MAPETTTWILTPDDGWHARTSEGAPAGFAFVECGEFGRAVEQTQVLPFGILPELVEADGTFHCDVCVAEIAVLA